MEKEIQRIQAAGVEIETNVVVGKTITMDEIMDQYACYLSVGAGAPNFMGIPERLERSLQFQRIPDPDQLDERV